MRFKLRAAVLIIALIWAAVILATSTVLAGAPQASRVLTILGGGAAASIILLGGLIAWEIRWMKSPLSLPRHKIIRTDF